MRNIVAFTGAGISKASGIPTFQDMDGVRDKLSSEYFMNNTGDFYAVLSGMKDRIDKAVPNAAHKALADYDIPVVTMNIDSLHKRAGSKQVVEVHGNLERVICTRCKMEFPFAQISKSLYCTECNGLLRPDVVLYGEMIPRYFEAISIIGSSNELLVIGTSFYTSTAADLVGRAERMGIKVKVINSNAETEVPRYLRSIL